MAELNKDGLVVGQEVDFTTIMRVNRERAKGAKNEPEQKPEPATSRPKKPSVSGVSKAKEKKEA
jgi:hypothetical protein